MRGFGALVQASTALSARGSQPMGSCPCRHSLPPGQGSLGTLFLARSIAEPREAPAQTPTPPRPGALRPRCPQTSLEGSSSLPSGIGGREEQAVRAT